jgi:glucose-1-phosphate thymidylyltransferase
VYGVVLAAGEGTRLRPLTAETPKGLVEVGGVPILTRCFETLVSLGVDELVVVVGYRADDVVSVYGERFGDVPITYAHQRERKGSAHALSIAHDYVEGDAIVMNGDNVCDANLPAVVSQHAETGADATLLVDEVPRERASETGVVAFDEEGRVAGLVEKPNDPPSNTVPRGFYVLSPRVFEACHTVDPSPTGEHELTAAIDRVCSTGGRVDSVDLEGWCVNVNTAADRDRAERLLGSRG